GLVPVVAFGDGEGFQGGGQVEAVAGEAQPPGPVPAGWAAAGTGWAAAGTGWGGFRAGCRAGRDAEQEGSGAGPGGSRCEPIRTGSWPSSGCTGSVPTRSASRALPVPGQPARA